MSDRCDNCGEVKNPDGKCACRANQMSATSKNPPACKGINCGCTDGKSHSVECLAELDAACSVDTEQERHINHSGWHCEFCGYEGQDNQPSNKFCSRCFKHK